MDYKLQSVRSR